MSQSVGLSARSFMTAGVSAALVGAVALTPVIVSEPAKVALPPVHVVAPEIQLASAGTTIKAFYDAAEPWAAYGAELATYALGFIPGLWWVAPGIDLAYFSIEPLVQAGVYSFADLIDANFQMIPLDIQAGIQEASTNFVNYGLAWLGSLVPLPPLPPLPPFPGAAVRSARGAARAAAPAAAATVAAAAEVTDVAPVATPRSRRAAVAPAASTPTKTAAAKAAAADNAGQKSRRSR